MRNKKEVKHKEDNTGLFIPAGLFIGLGTGGILGHWGAGLLLGLGIGFLLMAITKLLKGK
ncbi:MAG: hypothetical protein WC548_00460 [Candidatus Pacearchaeota archaeon]